MTLKAGASLTVPVTYTPTSPVSESGAISFVTTTGTFAFDLHGAGTEDGLLSDPSTLAFGEVPVGGNVTLDASITNSGSTTTTITGATGPKGPFSTDALPDAGTRLGAGNSVSVPIVLRADGGREVRRDAGRQVLDRRRHRARSPAPRSRATPS